MKKIILTLSTVFAVFGIAQAQNDKGWYIKPNVSYFTKVTPVEFPNVGALQPRETVYSINPTSGASSVVSEKTITGSFGKGIRGGVAFGYTFNQILSGEIAVNAFSSTEQTMMKQNAFAGSTELLSLKSTGKVLAIDLMPSLVLSFPTENKIKPYARVGVILPVYGYLKISTTGDDKTGMVASTLNPNFKAATLEREEKIHPKATIGFTSGLGLNIPISNKVSLTTELEYRNVSVGGKNKELTKFNAVGTLANGTQVPVGLDALPKSTTEVNYSKVLDASSNVPGHPGFDPNKPSDDLLSYINIGGLGLNVGLKFKF